MSLIKLSFNGSGGELCKEEERDRNLDLDNKRRIDFTSF